MHSNNDTTEHEPEYQQPQEVVAVELDVDRIDGPRVDQHSAGFGQEHVNALLRLLPDLDGHFDYVRDQADRSQRRVQKQREQRAFVLLVVEWRRCFFRRHEHQERLTEVPAIALRGEKRLCSE